MKHFEYFTGIDVSKATLDFSVVKEGKQLFYQRTANNPKAIRQLLSLVAKEYCPDLFKAVFCMEHTGIYNNHLLQALQAAQLTIWMESAMQIKRSIGVQRGKNDKIDAKRIALYAYKNREGVKVWQPSREQLQKLRQLLGIRKRLIKAKANLKKPLGELSFLSLQGQKLLKDSNRCSLDALQKDLDRVNKQIEKTIQKDGHLRHLFNLVTSVKGIGKVTATQMIVVTNEFKSITEAKKFACYAGIAPFEHTSGTSVVGRAHVSNIADKSTKCALHMAALAAVRESGELQDYFLRKVKEGKNKMSVINAVRNKLIHRVFACVRDNRLYNT
jgi:transposase